VTVVGQLVRVLVRVLVQVLVQVLVRVVQVLVVGKENLRGQDHNISYM
jgi:hypothetical protein